MPEGNSLKNQFVFKFSHSFKDTFSNFIESESSKLALRAAKSLCEDSKVSFYSLFIAGEPGLGKTHLLKAIGNYAQQTGKKVHYIDGIRFSQYFTSGETNEVENVLSEILQTDYFLLDDVHKISNSSEVQLKLYYIFNELNSNKKKIVFTAKQKPEHLTGIAEFLKSRFQWGMIVQLKAIHDKTISEIIRKIAGDQGFEIPAPVVNYLLTHIHRDYPSIRNAVDTINEASYLKKRKVTLPLVKKALRL